MARSRGQSPGRGRAELREKLSEWINGLLAPQPWLVRNFDIAPARATTRADRGRRGAAGITAEDDRLALAQAGEVLHARRLVRGSVGRKLNAVLR